MSFKIWGKEKVLNKLELEQTLEQLGVTDSFSLMSEIMRKGCASVGRTKIFLLK